MNKEFEKISSPLPETKQEHVRVPEKLESTHEFTEVEFTKNIEQALAEVESEPLKIMTAADKRIENIPMSIGLNQEKATAIFEQGGFAEKITLIKEQITSLVKITKEKIKNLISHQAEKIRSIELNPKVGILVDGNRIENQQIDIIKAPDETIHINFKLTEKQYNIIKEKYSKYEQSSIVYGSGDNNFKLADCWQKEIDGAIVKISTGEKDIDDIENKREIRSSLGLVEIILSDKDETKLTTEQINEKINQILNRELEIPNGLSLPEIEDEDEYKKTRYMWHHKTEVVPANIEENLTREEVFPAYFTFIEKDKHKEYQKISPYAVYHRIFGASNLPRIIRSGGLISSHERYKRGLITEGLYQSTDLDMQKGGADNVFTRIVTEGADKNITGVYFIFQPDLLDRTDWYSYDSDNFGSNDPKTFEHRLSPEELIKNQKQKYNVSNELMFRTGISIEKIKAIACATENDLWGVIDALRGDGITEINGKPIEQMIVMAPNVSDFLEISEEKPSKYQEKTNQILARHKKIKDSIIHKVISKIVSKI
ncbi:MAG: hypothetical protein HY773_02945 [Candidatus Terrybacteria bacterium]|nr:hypothetical protein [Candidatus Terrybacteria bacterium]